MLNRFDINFSGGRNLFQDFSIFSQDSGDTFEAGEGFTTEDSSIEATPIATVRVAGTDDEEFNDCVDEEEHQDDEDEDDDDDDSSDENGGRVALSYDNSQLSEIDGPPQNGHDYLRLVEKESRALPSIFSAQKPYKRTRETSESSSSSNQSTSTTLSAESHKSIDYMPMEVEKTTQVTVAKKPSKNEGLKLKTNIGGDSDDDLRFREDILNNFKRLREKIDAIRETKTIQSLSEQEKISEKHLKKTMDRSVRQANSLIRLMELGHPPQVSTLITKSQLELHLTLDKLADQCDIAPNCSKTIHTDWIYSLMAALREPIEPDIYSTLRRLARICIAKRKMFEAHPPNSTSGLTRKRQIGTMTKQTPENNEELVKELEEEEYTSSLLIICIVRFYFGQVDLK